MPKNARRVLLIDLDDSRRSTRVRLLESKGFEVLVRTDTDHSEELGHEGMFDMLIIALHRKGLKEATEYADRLQAGKPDLPILLLTDAGVFVPRGTLSKSLETNHPGDLIKEVATMLSSSTHVRELNAEAAGND